MTEVIERRYTNIIEAALSRPWAILPSKLALFAEILALRMDGRRFTDEEITMRVRMDGRQFSDEEIVELAARPRQQGRSTGDVKVLPVYGSIIPRGSSFSDVSGGQSTSMESFINDLNSAVADGTVKSILLDIDSPGGYTDMLPEAAAAIRKARTQKPVVGVANTMAASAAYWLGSQCSELVCTPSGEVGSIGVFAIHNDLSQQLQALGVNPTLIKAGKYKAETNSLGPLTEEAKAHVQEGVDKLYAVFTADVSKGRGTPVSTVRSGFGEGRMLQASDALTEGMVDRVDTLDNTLARMMRGMTHTAKVAYDLGDGTVASLQLEPDGSVMGFGDDDYEFTATDMAALESFSDSEASVEEASAPQDRLVGLRQRSRAAVTDERETYLSLLRRITK